MKAVILAGGLGTRISEESATKPKPMIEIGGKPILWHIMKIYSHYGINDFIICCGYKGYVIKEYFANYFLHNSDVTFDVVNNKMIVHEKFSEPWVVTLIDTGQSTMTGGRIKKVSKYLEGEESFCMTYGDGVSSINIKSLIEFKMSSLLFSNCEAPIYSRSFQASKSCLSELSVPATTKEGFPSGETAITNCKPFSP
jgi:glucose-1-phosphate cytidylyltransferase